MFQNTFNFGNDPYLNISITDSAATLRTVILPGFERLPMDHKALPYWPWAKLRQGRVNFSVLSFQENLLICDPKAVKPYLAWVILNQVLYRIS
jgi:hypothetical protein